MKICVIAPHCDDETLGCGGMLLKFKKLKIPISVIIVTEIKDNSMDKILNQIKKKYKLNNLYRLKYSPSKLDLQDKDELIQRIKSYLVSIKASDVFIPNESDIHSDHGIVHRASLAASKWYRNNYTKKILVYETLSETEIFSKDSFTPNYFIDITDHIEDKCNIMKIYKKEIKKFPFPRSKDSIISLAKFRGTSCGYKFAESFKIIFSK
ncbi:PIG-L family deacetylase [Pelagibacterales bacterium SAG-MED08]|nr:PIG-L family deacetylase [Pelagibacterales bacterium SAG-MED08]|tara:strand:+ start:582 stop:1208 length:627 start_codon:yes stop_codon:yes gene_type:complete